VLAQALDRFDAKCLAYCLMGSHYNLVPFTREGNLSRLMRQLNGVYTQAYNFGSGGSGGSGVWLWGHRLWGSGALGLWGRRWIDSTRNAWPTA